MAPRSYLCCFLLDPGVIPNKENDDHLLHVPSPEWKDQILYFIVTDRFMDGDTTNNDQGVGEYKKEEMAIIGMAGISKALLRR